MSGHEKENGQGAEGSAADGTAAGSRSNRKATGAPASRRPPVITVDEYNALWRAYRENPNASAAGKAAGVKTKVARWYCEGPGWPEVGFVPLAQRLRTVQAAVVRLEDTGHAQWRAKKLEVLRQGMQTTEAAMAIIQRGVRELAEKVTTGDMSALGLVLDKDSPLTPARVTATYDKQTRLALLLMGEPDSQPAAASPGHLNFAEWTAEECQAYYERGIIPERERR